jgi:type II secretory pathway pseudopilin PulG
MIELLVVIGIILVLIGLFFAGAKIVTGQAKERDTRNMLEICKTMFENYRQATKLSRVMSTYTTVSPPATTTGPINLQVSNTGSVFTTPVATPQYWSLGQVSAPGIEPVNTYPGTSITPDAIHLNDSNYSNRPASLPYPRLPIAVADTELLMQAMLTIPENQTIFNNIPSNKVMKDAVTGIPLILDGWGNPILFCPAGGLAGVFNEPGDHGYYTVVVTSSAIQAYSWDPTSLPPGTPLSNQPFFFSAGPDGDPANAHGQPYKVTPAPPGGANLPTPPASNPNQYQDMSDDNIYSFQ